MDEVDQIKNKLDIVEVISAYVPLKKAGRNFSGLCPFHSEKTPSFMVSAERQAYKCFGCSESGDIFSFVQKLEGWDFKEALEELAKRAGVTLTKRVTKSTNVKEKIVSINTLLAKFYAHLLLAHPAGKKAREYLLNRGIKKETWEKFSLGYAPQGWDNALKLLVKRGFGLPDIAESGVIVAKEGQKNSYYDRFRDRITFALKDNKGAILGFSARALGEVEVAKYINSPQSVAFSKGSLLYGFDTTKEAIREKNEAVLVEGEFDFLSVYQVGVKNVVASKGTALTDAQVIILARICQNVALCFDSDSAGESASLRGIELLEAAGVNVKVVKLSGYSDPDEFCQKDASGFIKAVGEAIPIYDFLISVAVGKHNVATALGKKNIGKAILPVIFRIKDDLVKAHYVEKLAQILDLDVAIVRLALENVADKKTDFNLVNELENGDPVQGMKAVKREEYFLALLSALDEVPKNVLTLLRSNDFADVGCAAIWGYIRAIIKPPFAGGFKKALNGAPSELNKLVDNIYLVNVGPYFEDKLIWQQEVEKQALRIKSASVKRQLEKIAKNMKAAQFANDLKKVDSLAKRFDKLSKSIKVKL